jgi:hypothetical protein
VTIMTLTISDTTMTSDHTAHTARQTPGLQHQWEVSWLPGQTLDRITRHPEPASGEPDREAAD